MQGRSWGNVAAERLCGTLFVGLTTLKGYFYTNLGGTLRRGIGERKSKVVSLLWSGEGQTTFFWPDSSAIMRQHHSPRLPRRPFLHSCSLQPLHISRKCLSSRLIVINRSSLSPVTCWAPHQRHPVYFAMYFLVIAFAQREIELLDRDKSQLLH